jgi:HD-GYP domain-containing protein (c-di-GMP phosphodiesterase class II)
LKKIYFLVNSEAPAGPIGDLLKRLRGFGYTFVSIGSLEEISAINQPEAKLAIVNVEAQKNDPNLATISSSFKERFPQVQQMAVFSGVLEYDQAELLKSDVDVVYQYPFDDELILNHCFEVDPVDLDNSQLSYEALARVNVMELKAGDKLPFALYVYLPANGKIIPYNHKNHPLTDESLTKFKNNQHYNLYVKKSELSNYYNYCAASLKADKESMTEHEYLQEATKKMKGLMSGFFDKSKVSDPVENAQLLDNLGKIVSQLEDASGSKVDLMQEVNKVAAKQMTNYTHARNMATYCALFGMVAGINEPQTLRIGGLLHDLGMMDLPLSLLQKNEEDMDEMEMAQYKLHPGNGKLSIVEKGMEIPRAVEKMIMQHHEHSDGSGFPYGLTANEIDPFAKVCAFADVFDTYTSVREGYQQMSPALAMARISGRGGKKPHPIYDPNFHGKIVDAFLEGEFEIPEMEGSKKEQAPIAEKAQDEEAVGEVKIDDQKPSYGKIKSTEPNSKEADKSQKDIKKDLGYVLSEIVDENSDGEGAA